MRIGGFFDLEGIELVILYHVVETVLNKDDSFDQSFDVELLQDLCAALSGVFE